VNCGLERIFHTVTKLSLLQIGIVYYFLSEGAWLKLQLMPMFVFDCGVTLTFYGSGPCGTINV